MAACCSSTCATITASPSAWSSPIARLSRAPRSCAPSGWCAPKARSSRACPRPSTRICRPARWNCAFEKLDVLSEAEDLPLPVFGEPEYPEETRLKYRFLDLRRETLHRNIMKRSAIIASLRRRMNARRLLRIPDADPDRVLAGRRARLPGALAHSSGQVLRSAAGAAAVQAAPDDLRLRPLFPDRAVLSRRGRRAPTGCPANSTSSTSK